MKILELTDEEFAKLRVGFRVYRSLRKGELTLASKDGVPLLHVSKVLSEERSDAGEINAISEKLGLPGVIQRSLRDLN